MSKAFTREDDTGDAPVAPRPMALVPPGTRNYLTPAGAARLRAELAGLMEHERPEQLARSTGGGLAAADAKQELGRIEQRLELVGRCLATAEIVAPPMPPHDTVRFGATVTVRDARGGESTYRIVGADEADTARDEVSWLSPVARALLQARLGQRVPFKFPTGATQLEIMAIRYE